ncbi:hypothetical protein PGT21_031628 [Puccinia graminis f. sp. tritici]|uniref:Secreted protein n=1 Tax=Puccinia graminis f. sp. tritici TaxID=56615 RepID=A0A5B0QPJ3_PUCGR|nr:hypothetical protein PGT21_031628 [Puccinia graminis f. sp. tritici]
MDALVPACLLSFLGHQADACIVYSRSSDPITFSPLSAFFSYTELIHIVGSGYSSPLGPVHESTG